MYMCKDLGRQQGQKTCPLLSPYPPFFSRADHRNTLEYAIHSQKMALHSQDEESPMLADDTLSRGTKAFKLKQHTICILVHLALICLYTAVSVRIVQARLARLNTSLHRESHSYLPISYLTELALPGVALSYQPNVYADFELSPFAGLPSPVLDRSWHDLLANTSLRVSGDELKDSNQTSVALPGGGYMAWLGVYHELHCIVSRSWRPDAGSCT